MKLSTLLDEDYNKIRALVKPGVSVALPESCIYKGQIPGAHEEASVYRKNTNNNYRNTKNPDWPEIDIASEMLAGYVYYTVYGLVSGIWNFILVRENAAQRWLTPEGCSVYQRMPQEVEGLFIEDFDVVSVAAVTTAAVEYGAKCGECGEYYEYAVRVPNFRCTGCKLRATMF